MNTAYRPNPVDTAEITLPDEIVELREQLAKNTHEVWAQGRWEEGWRYGTERDDGKKLHPCIVPYEALSESEKDYDRRTAEETLKLILALGFEIRKQEE